MSSVRKFKVTVAYDGTRYYGWQVQKGVPTVAQAINDVASRVFDEKIRMLGVSRTDTGVHARGQVATFITQRPADARSVQFALNNALPEDIRIGTCQHVPLDYNPFLAIDHKIYHYHIMSSQALPFHVRYGWRIQRMIDFQKLHDTLQVFVGTHNFRSFSTGDDRGDKTIRTINSITLQELPHLYAHRIVIKGPAFLRYMIRRIVGAAMEIAWDRTRNGQELADALANPSARQRFLNAPACGLILHRIVYTSDSQEIFSDQTNFLV